MRWNSALRMLERFSVLHRLVVNAMIIFVYLFIYWSTTSSAKALQLKKKWPSHFIRDD